MSLNNTQNQEYANLSTRASEIFYGLSPIGESNYLARKKVKNYGGRFGHGFIALPISDINGNIQSIQYIYDEGTLDKRFLKDAKLQGNFLLIGHALHDDAEAFLCEGYATGATTYENTNITTIVAFSLSNIPHVIKELKSKYHNIRIIIAADNDQWKEQNIGKLKAEECAKQFNCEFVVPIFANPSIDLKPTDFNDLYCIEGESAVKKQLNSILNKPRNIVIANDFECNYQGLFHNSEKIGNEIYPVLYARDFNSKNWLIKIRFKNLDEKYMELTIGLELLNSDNPEFFNMLLSMGYVLYRTKNYKNRLIKYLLESKTEDRAECVLRTGWYDKYFVLPNMVIPDNNKILFKYESVLNSSFSQSGTLKEWKDNIGILCQENSRLILALCSAFAPPLLYLLNKESGGFNLVGPSSIGKSTALLVACSVWGNLSLIQQWRNTDNALEALAESYNHLLLVLDELGQADSKKIGEVIYMLSNGSGKNRLKSHLVLNKKFNWLLMFLSSGEITLTQKISEAYSYNKEVKAGMLTRMIDISADAGKNLGIFDNLHNFDTGEKLSNHIKEQCKHYHGTPIIEYLRYLTQFKNNIEYSYKLIKEDFFNQFVPNDSDGQVKRVADRFAILATAGELAIKLGILPFDSQEAFKAMGACFLDWVDNRGGVKSHESMEAINQVMSFIQINHSSRFTSLDTSSDFEKIHNRAGFKRNISNSINEFLIFGKVFKNEVCKGLNFKEVCKILENNQLMHKDKEGRYSHSVRLPIGQTRVYIVRYNGDLEVTP